jgi:hypothetical protein
MTPLPIEGSKEGGGGCGATGGIRGGRRCCHQRRKLCHRHPEQKDDGGTDRTLERPFHIYGSYDPNKCGKFNIKVIVLCLVMALA